jgi:hypothetical protein
MKKLIQKVAIGLLFIMFMACSKDTEGLPRDNVYDLNRTDQKNIFVVDSIIIIEESIVADGLLQNSEKMFLAVYIGNIGTEPGRILSCFFDETATSTLNFQPQQTVSGITDFTGNFVVDKFIEPGENAMVFAGNTPGGSLPYSIRVEKDALATSPSEIGDVKISDLHGNEWTVPFTINIL